MKITSKMASKTVGTRRALAPVFFIIFALVFTAMGCLILFAMGSAKDFVPTTARITDITVDDEVYVEYVVGSQRYNEKTNSYSSSYRVGQELKIKYNPDDPHEIVDGSMTFGYVVTGIGLVMLVAAIYSLVNNFKKKKAYEELGESGVIEEKYLSKKRVSDILPGFRPDFSEGEENEYYFRYFGKAGQGHIMETPDREAVYEAKLVKFSLLGESEYEFEDYIHGTKSTHFIGKTTTVGKSRSGYFNLDGEDALDILRSSGYTVDTELGKIPGTAEYTINYNGEVVGHIKNAGSAIVPNVKSNKFTENMIANGLYKIYCKEENIPIMFIYALSFTRTGMLIYE